jgi:hypothetical protein
MYKYNNNVTLILDYLVKNKYCSTTIQANQRCFCKLEAYLSNNGIIILQKSQMNGTHPKIRQLATRI